MNSILRTINALNVAINHPDLDGQDLRVFIAIVICHYYNIKTTISNLACQSDLSEEEVESSLVFQKKLDLIIDDPPRAEYAIWKIQGRLGEML